MKILNCKTSENNLLSVWFINNLITETGIWFAQHNTIHFFPFEILEISNIQF